MTVTLLCFVAGGSLSVGTRNESINIRSAPLTNPSGSEAIWSATAVSRSSKTPQVAIQGD